MPRMAFWRKRSVRSGRSLPWAKSKMSFGGGRGWPRAEEARDMKATMSGREGEVADILGVWLGVGVEIG